MLTVLPDLYLIWKVQRQMVADIFALHGRSAEQRIALDLLLDRQ